MSIIVMKNFTIVEFSDSAMEVVPSSWVDRSTGAILCYWTAHNMRAQVSACHLPNKSWAKYAVKKIWLCTATFPDNSWRFDQRYCHPSHATASGNQ
ncbi:hypothetical protein R3I93_004507 [Phoxinus phoxinus]|uniref:Uncharacterized protein n=1 Tax=Phoxinus phoxinus TaxID=58324 RepID=A0AAN9DFF3_9TELE